MSEIALIAALDRHRAIGRGNTLPWHLPDDLKRFKALTQGHAVLMGRKTALSIGRALPGRRNLVLTHSGSAPYEGQEGVSSLGAALARVEGLLFVIGGGEIYAQTLPLAQRLHLTRVDTVVEGADTWFPPIDSSQWHEASCESHAADERHAFGFVFVDYERR